MIISQYKLISTIALCATTIIPGLCSAAPILTQGDWVTTLQPRFLKNSSTVYAYYDTSLDITWLANANAAVGSAYDTASPGSGEMSWYVASNWAANLKINGITGWSLPTLYPGDAYITHPSSSQLAHMFFTTLGNTTASIQVQPGGGTQGGFLSNTGPFSNLLTDAAYWSSTDVVGGAVFCPASSCAYGFGTAIAFQYPDPKTWNLNAWAIHVGDVSTLATPVPAAVWLFGSGLIGLLTAARRKAL